MQFHCIAFYNISYIISLYAASYNHVIYSTAYISMSLNIACFGCVRVGRGACNLSLSSKLSENSFYRIILLLFSYLNV